MPSRLLIAEDNPLSLSLLKLMLESAGEYEVVTAKDGLEAWALLEAGPAFDLCLLDIMMPGLDGFELTARMRADPRFQGQRIIFCTAHNDRTTVDQAAALAASHYIVKPYFREHVLKQVRRICAEPVVVSLETPAQAAARLGLEPAQVATFQQDLQQAVERLVTDLRRGAPSGGVKPHLRANSLKGAAMNLGARGLAEQLGALEVQLNDLTAPRLAQTIAAVETEGARLRQVSAAA